MFLLDTNTVIYFFKEQGKVEEMLFQVPPNQIAISSITFFELEFGITKSQSLKRKKDLEQLLSTIQFVDFSYEEAQEAAKIKADLEKKGQPIGPFDLLIAGTAIANNLTLVTRNLKEFERVENLKIINWY